MSKREVYARRGGYKDKDAERIANYYIKIHENLIAHGFTSGEALNVIIALIQNG